MSRKQYTIHYIYKTTNIITGKFYIGMHSAFNLDDVYLGSGKRLRYSLKKHGIENHKKEILEFCKDRNELKKREEEIVNIDMIHDKMCMNLMEGGTGGYNENAFGGSEGRKKGRINANKTLLFKLQTDAEYYERFCKATKDGYKKWLSEEGRHNNFYGKHHTIETIKKMKLNMKGKQLGNLNSQYNKIWIHNKELNVSKIIKKDELQKYIELNWLRGRKIYKYLTESEKLLLSQKQSIAQSGYRNHNYGKTWIYKDDTMELKSVLKDTVLDWIKLGWKRGFKIEYKKKKVI